MTTDGRMGYCLNELCDMLASEKPVIPVFYDVEPENLRRTDVGPFAEAFEERARCRCGEMESGSHGCYCHNWIQAHGVWQVRYSSSNLILEFSLNSFTCDDDVITFNFA